MFEKIAHEAWSGREVCRWLKNDMNFKTRYGKHLTIGNIHRLFLNPFYYGEFEYPKGGGNWYKGIHTPIVSKELFDKVQERIAQRRSKKTWRTKEFEFTRLMKCGYCNSGITAEEKHKYQKNGNVHRYVYYGCTRFNDVICKNKYIREEDLLKQLLELMDTVKLDKLGIKDRLEQEAKKYYQFRKGVLGVQEDEQEVVDADIRSFAKYILKEGNILDKRLLLQNLKSKIYLKDKKISLRN